MTSFLGSAGVDGLASGIQTGELVEAMIAADRSSTRLIEERKTVYEARLEAVQGLNTRLLAAQMDVLDLKRRSSFQARTATSGNSSVLGATATSTAEPGLYTFEVTAVASAHQIATGALGGETSATADLGAGSVTLQVGSGTTETFDFTADASSLEDIAQAVNDADMGITAYVIDTGAASDPYRLVLQADEQGTDHAITVSGESGGLASLFDGANIGELTAANDAGLQLGSGGGAISFTSTDNTFEDVVPGLTVTAREVGSTTVTVGTDTETTVAAVEGFVTSLNAAIEYFNANASYDTDAEEAGILFSETMLRSSVTAIRNTLFEVVDTLPKSMNNATALGFGLDRRTGLITLDSTELAAKLAADPDAVADLFLNTGQSSDTGIAFGALSEATQADSPFAVEITTPAERAASSTGTLTEPITIDGGNNSFAVVINGDTYNLTLASGDYTTEQMAEHLQDSINAAVANENQQVTVSASGGVLTMETAGYGSSQRLQVLASGANGTLGFDTAEQIGVDVAGTIDGEVASGDGQILQGVDGSASEGLYLVVGADAPIASATVTVTKGLGQRLAEKFTALTSVDDGTVPQVADTLTSNISDLQEQIEKADAMLELRRERYLAEFRRMETLIGEINNQGDMLKMQIDAFSFNATKDT